MALTYQLIVLLGLSSGLWMGANANCQKGCCTVCPDGWTPKNHRCYRFFKEPKDWSDAEDACQDLGGSLAPVLDGEAPGLREMVKEMTGGKERTWFGGYQVNEGLWKFSNGEVFDFHDWGHLEPNNYNGKPEDCMEMMHRNHHNQDQPFNDAPCNHTKAYMCARDPIAVKKL